MSNTAQPLRYLIGVDADPGVKSAVTELGYDATVLPAGGAIKYGNLRDQASPKAMREQNTGNYGPYLPLDPDDDIFEEYKEPAPDPNGPGFRKLVDEQLDEAQHDGWPEFEWDNLDTYDSDVALRVFDLTSRRGMMVAVKNPNLVDGDKLALIQFHGAARMIVEHDKDVTAGALHKLRSDGGKPDLPIHVVTHGNQKSWAQQIANQAIALGLKNFQVTYSKDGEYASVEDILLPTNSTSAPMGYSLTWLPGVLRAAGLNVVETPGWENRGHGDIGTVQGVMCHHTSTPNPNRKNMPTLQVLIDGNGETAGPLTQLGLGLDGTYYVICAGKGWHAGASDYSSVQGISDGNSHLIGIEGEHAEGDSWPAAQMDAYVRGVAALLTYLKQPVTRCIAHKEWTPSRRNDPSFDMTDFRSKVAAAMGVPAPRPVIGLGDSGDAVREAQKLLGLAVTGSFDDIADRAVRAFQQAHGLAVDGIIGPNTWPVLLGRAQQATRFTNITATVFADNQVAYSDVAPGWNSRMGVALPYRFSGKRPQVRVFKGGKSVVCDIIDIGPWYDGTAAKGPFDPYWQTNSRPRAESDPRTNGAGIDLTPPADAALGVNGKGLVDWEFVKDAVKPPPEPDDTPSSIPAVEAALKDIAEALRPILEKHMAPQPAPPPPAPQIDLTAIVNLVQQLPQIIAAIQQIVSVMQSLKPILAIFGVKLPDVTAVPDQPKTGGVSGATVGAAGAGVGIGGLIGTLITAFMQAKVPQP